MFQWLTIEVLGFEIECVCASCGECNLFSPGCEDVACQECGVREDEGQKC